MTEPAHAEVATAPPRDFALLLPADWVRLTLDGKAKQHVVWLVARSVAAMPVHQREGVRTAMTSLLTQAVEDARAAGGIDMLLWISTRNGLPVSASGLVVVLQQGRQQLAGVLDDLVAGELETRLAVVGGHSAVRRRRTTPIPLDEHLLAQLDAATREESGDELAEQLRQVARATPQASTSVDYFVPVPDTDSTLLFSFSTPIAALAPALERLFDAIMDGLRWVS